jgi:apolipoprotein N-acyltransferase
MKRFKPLLPFLFPFIGGVLMGLTPAPVEAWPLAWIAQVPLWIVVVRSQSIRRSALYGLVWGLGYHGLALFWITGVHPMTWMGVPWLASLAIALFCWLFITLWGAASVTLWGVAMTVFQNSIPPKSASQIPAFPLLRVFLGVAFWCGVETLLSISPLYWTSLSYTQSPHNLVILHLGQLSGPLTVTAAIVAVNGLLAEAYRNVPRVEANGHSPPRYVSSVRQFAYLSLAAGLLILSHAIGFGLYSRPLIQPPETALKVGVIQGNIPNTIKLYPAGWLRAIEGYTTGYKTLAQRGVEAVLTPETALPFEWQEQVRRRSSFYLAILDEGVLAWVGAFGDKGESLTNSLCTVTGAGETVSRYDKVKLVPLGEYIPFASLLGDVVDRLSPLDAHLAAGEPKQVFETPFGRAIASICYESAFSGHFRHQAADGGQFILSSSNNAHYSPTMPAQHHAQDVMRAIETDRWEVRATNTGYSGIVDPHGRTLWISGLNTYEIHDHTIYRRQTRSLYVRWGDWLTRLLLGVGAIGWFVLYLKVRGWRTKTGENFYRH